MKAKSGQATARVSNRYRAAYMSTNHDHFCWVSEAAQRAGADLQGAPAKIIHYENNWDFHKIAKKCFFFQNISGVLIVRLHLHTSWQFRRGVFSGPCGNVRYLSHSKNLCFLTLLTSYKETNAEQSHCRREGEWKKEAQRRDGERKLGRK